MSKKYVIYLLSENGLLGAKPVETPMDSNLKILAHDGVLLEDYGRYKRLVGKHIYQTPTRTNISFAVSVVSQ